MERCVGDDHRDEALQLCCSQGFFEGLPPMEGSLQAMEDMEKEGLQVYIVTAPMMTSLHCAQEKINWVRKHLGERWLDKLVLCTDKSAVRGDLLIDDKPLDLLSPFGLHTTAKWKQVIFDAPYNKEVKIPRLNKVGIARHLLTVSI